MMGLKVESLGGTSMELKSFKAAGILLLCA